MKRRVVGIVIFLAFLQAGCFAQTQENLSETKKEEVSDPYTWDFGFAKQGEVLKHTFILKNESTKALNIKQVNTSCGCTISEVKKKTLLPQASTEIAVEFKTKGYSGPVKQHIYVTTDSLDNPIIKFIIKADVVK